MRYLTPHTPEWFTALELCNQEQASATRQVVQLAKGVDVCSICGDRPTIDYKIVGTQFASGTGATIRLCDDCREVRRSVYGESFIRL